MTGASASEAKLLLVGPEDVGVTVGEAYDG